MGWFSRWKRSRKEQPAPADALAVFPPWATPARRGTTQLLRAYKEAPWLRAVVHKVATAVSQVNWRLYVRGSSSKSLRLPTNIEKGLRDAHVKALVRQGRLTELEDHPLLELLDRPNAQMTGAAMLALLQVHQDLKGESFVVKHRPQPGRQVDGLFPVPPSWVTSTPNAAQRKFSVVPMTGRGSHLYDEDDVLFVRDLDPELPYGRGTGIAESLGDELETDEYASRFVKAFFYNGGLPGAIVSFEGANQVEAKKAKEMWLSEHQGASNANKPNFVGGKVSVTRLDTSFKDQSLVDMRIMLRDFVRQVYGVPPEVLGITEDSNRATANTAYFLFAQNVVLPRLEVWRAHLFMGLVSAFGSDLFLDFDSPVPADRDQQLQVMKSFPFAFSLAEFRELAGAEPVAGFEEMYPPMTMPGQAPTAAPDLASAKKPKAA